MKTINIIDTYKIFMNSDPEEADLNISYPWHTLRDIINDIENGPRGRKSYIVKAKLGMWDGYHDGGKIIQGLNNVIDMINDNNASDIHIFFEGYTLRVDAYHHDGVNHFYIRELTPEGESFIENMDKHPMTDKELHNHLYNSKHRSRQVSWLKKYYD